MEMMYSQAEGREYPSNSLRLNFFLLCFIISCIAYIPMYQSMMFVDGDSPWHLKAGDYIRQHGLPLNDSWSFTAGNFIWYNISWLYDIVVSFLASTIGLEGLLLVVIVMTALTVCLIMDITLLSGCGIIAALIAMAIVIGACKPTLSVRPQAVSMLLAAMCYMAMLSARKNKSIAPLMLLPFITALWVNVHGAFLVIYTMLGAFWLDALFKKDKQQLIHIIATGIMCVLAVLVNPYGVDIFKATLLTFDSPMNAYIHEWQPANLKEYSYTYIYLLTFLFLPLRKMYQDIAVTLLALFWSIMALQSNRYLGIQAIFATPVLALCLHECFSKSKWGEIYRARLTAYAKDLSHKLLAIVCAALVVLIIGAMQISAVRQHIWREPLLDAARYPLEEIQFIEKHYPQANVFNHYDYGGLLIYTSAGKLKPIFDGRASTAYPLSAVKDYLRLEQFDAGWENILKEKNITVALLPNGLTQAYHLQAYEGWYKVLVGKVATVWAIKKPAS